MVISSVPEKKTTADTLLDVDTSGNELVDLPPVAEQEEFTPFPPKRRRLDMPSSVAHLLKFDGKQLRPRDLPDGSRVVVHKGSGPRTLHGLQDLRRDPNFCDVKFQVEGAELLAHRCMLVLHSAYFQAMFADGFREGSSMWTVIPLAPGIVDRSSAEALLDFMYTGQLTVTTNTVQGLITAAELWQMSEVKDACVDFMEVHIDIHNCLEILSFVELYGYKTLIDKCHQLIKLRFPVVCQTPEFLALPAATLAHILSFKDLTLGPGGEDVVLEALFRWLEFDSQRRLGELPSLLKEVRLNQTSPDCRAKLLHGHHLIQGNAEIKQLVDKLLTEETKPRTPRASLCVINGYNDDKKRFKVLDVERLDPLSRFWMPCAAFPMPEAADAMAFAVHGRVFVVAYEPVMQQQGDKKVKATEAGVYEYRFIHDEWLDAKPSFSPHALQSLDACLQAEGAITVCSRTNTIYAVSHSGVRSIPVELSPDGDVSCRTVQQLPPVPVGLFSARQRSFAAVVVDGRLYVLGGDRQEEHRGIPLPSAQVVMFDPGSNVWVARANMLEPRAKLAAVQCGGHIYACGGFNNQRVNSMERYDPVTDTWSPLHPMTYFRSHHQLLVLNDHIWALGGKSHASEFGHMRSVVKNCEVYNPVTDTWKEGPAMKAARYGFAAVVI